MYYYLRLACIRVLLPGIIMVGVPTGVSAQASGEEKTVTRLLTASGVPNDEGLLRWPTGLMLLGAPGVDELREQIEALFGEAARQAAGGQANSVFAEEARQTVKQLRRLLLKDKNERFTMTLAVYEESERFLNKLDRAERLLRTNTETTGGQGPLREKGLSTPDSTGPAAASSLDKEYVPQPAYPNVYGQTNPFLYGQIEPYSYGPANGNYGKGTSAPSGRRAR